MIAALLLLQAVTRFGDWTVACDERARCEALSQPPADASPGDYPPFVVRGPIAPVIEVPIPASVAAGTRLTLAVDGRVLALVVAPGGARGLSLPLTGALERAVTRGRLLTLATPARRMVARASLKGLAAARAAHGAPAAGALPAIDQPPVTARAPRSLSRKQMRALTSAMPAACTTPTTRGYRLDAQHTLIAIDPGCTPRATWFFVLPEKGAPYPAGFDVPAAATSPAHRIAGDWDGRRRRITALLPASADVDCGTWRDFAWDGVTFRLAEERVITECRRATRQIVTRRAPVTIH